MIVATRDRPPFRAFIIGWLSGTLAYSGLLYWLITTFHAAHVSPLLAIACLLFLAAFLGLFWGLWASCIAHCHQPFFVAAAWVTLEYVRTYLFSGFPWALFGDSQYRHLALIQVAGLTGVYGVSFLVVFISATVAFVSTTTIPSYPFTKKTGRREGLAVISATMVLIAVYFFGVLRLRQARHNDAPPTYRVALLQGSIDQYQKWDERYVEVIKGVYRKLVIKAALSKPDLIVWPETSVPGYLLQDPPLRSWLMGVIHESGTSHLVGAPALEGSSAYNAAFLISQDGQIEGGYAKKHLVPFGEIIPWGPFLGRWIHALNDLGGFMPGHWPSVVKEGSIPIGVNICYEAIFPDLVRRSVAQGAELIVNVTNDGWYMHTSEPYQHLIPNIFRAVENARWLVRADNSGISAVIDPYGHVVAASSIYEGPVVVSALVEPRRDMTFYTHVGDSFAWLCVLLSCLGLVLGQRQRNGR